MKNLLTILLSILLSNFVFAQKTNSNYDAELANELQADEYGMKYYIFAILKTGSDTPEDQDLRAKSFAGHMTNIKKLVEDGKLIVAGPMDKNDKNYRGIFILDVQSIEEAQLLLNTDPAIKEGFLDTELFKWYGSAALPEYLETSDKIWKVGF